MPRAQPESLSPEEVWSHIDPLAPDSSVESPRRPSTELPYLQLGGRGFERLLYEILQSEGLRPWFFGRSGQSQFGIDLVTDVEGVQSVYQCKNYANAPNWSELQSAIRKFESEWLAGTELKAPQEFVYCCPHKLDDTAFLIRWESFKQEFKQRTGVALSFLDKTALDSKLRRLPDLVGGLFSDSWVEDFCNRDGWCDDPWIRLRRGEGRLPGVSRFLERHYRDAIHISEHYKNRFSAALDQRSVVVLRGLPGTGKTFLALELACRLPGPAHRIYYATLKSEAPAERLWQSARRRLSLPSLFVLDDCHFGLGSAQILLERLAPEIESGKLKLVLLLRDQVSAEVDRIDDTPEWLGNLDGEQLVVDLRADVERTLAVTCHLRPEFDGLSRSRLARLHTLCGGDLLLLDEALQAVSSPQDIDGLEAGGLLAKVRTHYFGGNRRLPTIAKLATLAQFDILPHADFLASQWLPGEEEWADPLMAHIFSPPRYQFLHSSLAELVLRALAQLDEEPSALEWAIRSSTIEVVRAYLLHLARERVHGRMLSHEFIRALQLCLKGKLKLASAGTNRDIATALLEDPDIQHILESNLADCGAEFFGSCFPHLEGSAAKVRYLELAETRLSLLGGSEVASSEAGEAVALSMLRVLSFHAPERLRVALDAPGVGAILRRFLSKRSVGSLVRILVRSKTAFCSALLDLVGATERAAIVESADGGMSKTSLDMLALETKHGRGMLERFEQAITAEGFFRAISRGGTLFDLFGVMANASPAIQKELAEKLLPQHAADLLDRTIATGNSLGTLNLRMRKLGYQDGGPGLLAQLEKAVGTEGFIRLIMTGGTFQDFLSILQRATSGFRGELLSSITAVQVAILVDATSAKERGIEAVHFQLKGIGASPEHLSRLEQLTGVNGWWQLFKTVGTLNSVHSITAALSDSFRADILDAAVGTSEREWTELIERGFFSNACAFSANDLCDYPAIAIERHTRSLARAAGPLAGRAAWSDLNASRLSADAKSTADSILRAAFRARLDAVQLVDLVGLDFREAVNGFACLWRERPDLRLELGTSVRAIVPPRNAWPRDKGNAAVLRLVLNLARSSDFPASEVHWLLDEVVAFLDQEVCEQMDTLLLFLLIWNIAALAYERAPRRSFIEIFPVATQEFLEAELAERVELRASKLKKVTELALGGLLSLLFPWRRRRLTEILETLRGETWKLTTICDGTGFSCRHLCSRGNRA